MHYLCVIVYFYNSKSAGIIQYVEGWDIDVPDFVL